jgi:hypothetical protein
MRLLFFKNSRIRLFVILIHCVLLSIENTEKAKMVYTLAKRIEIIPYI